MDSNEPLPPDTPKSGYQWVLTIILSFLAAPFILYIIFYMVTGGLLFIMLLWKGLTCSHCEQIVP